MAGEILTRARQAVKNILNGGFASELTITPTGGSPVLVNGLATRHRQSFDTDGLPVLGVNSDCTFVEKELNDLGLVTRNGRKDVIIEGWKVEFTDEIDNKTYTISEPYADETLGLIRCTLTDRE